MKIEIRNRTACDRTYRAERARGLFNVSEGQGSEFDLDVEIPFLDGEASDWRIGLVYGPSGSGKSSIGRALVADGWSWWDPTWSRDRAVISDIAIDGGFDEVTGALASVGLGSVPTWLRPYHVLSGGEQFRASLARLVAEAPDRMVVDEFTSVVDRRVAQIGSAAFAKAWRRGPFAQVVLLTPHYDVAEWLNPDWVLELTDTSTKVATTDVGSVHRLGTRSDWPEAPAVGEVVA